MRWSGHCVVLLTLRIGASWREARASAKVHLPSFSAPAYIIILLLFSLQLLLRFMKVLLILFFLVFLHLLLALLLSVELAPMAARRGYRETRAFILPHRTCQDGGS